MTDAEVLAGRNDLEMLKRPHLWPMRPLLCLKKYLRDEGGNIKDMVFGVYREGYPDYVYQEPEQGRFTWPHIGPESKVLEYEGPEAVVADGWVVD